MNTLVKKYKALPIPVKATLWFTFCSILQRGISFITVPIFTRILTIEEYGIYSIYLSWHAIFTIFCTLKIYSGSYINGLYKFKNDKRNYTFSVQVLILIISFIIFFIFILFENKICFWLDLSKQLIYLMFFSIIFNCSIQCWITLQRIEMKYIKLVALTILISIINPILGICAVLYTDIPNVTARVLAIFLVEFFVGGYIYLFNYKKCKKVFCLLYWKYTLKFELPLLPHHLSLIILGQSDRIMINYYSGAQKAALYSLAYNISMIIQVIKESIRDAFVPWLYEKLSNKDYEGIKEIINFILIIMSIFTFLFIALAPELIVLMGSSSYLEAILIIPPVSTSVYFTFLYIIFSTIEFFFEKTKFTMYGSIISAFLNLFLNYIFIKKYGYLAAGYTTLICYIFLSILHYIIAKKILKQNSININKIIDKYFIFYYSCFILILSFIFLSLYKYIYMRYIIILIIISILLKNKKKILFLLKTIKKLKKEVKNE